MTPTATPNRLAPALSILAFLLALSCGSGSGSPDGRQVIVLGFDGMDPDLTQELLDAGRLPNIARLIESGQFDELETAIPPQSPVAWSNFITGMDAGGHGTFDFIHRDPDTLLPSPSGTGQADASDPIKIGKYKIDRGGGYVSLRQGIPFWAVLEENGVESTILRMPANFPPSGLATRELTGMGTQDLLGTDGTFSFYTSELFAFAGQDITGGNIYELDIYDNVVRAQLHGPDNPFLQESEPLTQDFTVYLDYEHETAKVELGDQSIVIGVGEWSDWLQVEFSMIPSQKVYGQCRMYLRGLEPEFELYVSPIDIDPYSPSSPISTPDSYAAELADATGRFYTEGMPEDTKAYTDEVFSAYEFLEQAHIAGDEIYEQYSWVLDQYLERDGGFLFYYVGNVDQIGHMIYRGRDPEHPLYDPEVDAQYEDLIPTQYEKLDALVGHTLDHMDPDTLVIVMSDHGFTSWRRALHLNAWLAQEGYLTVKDPNATSDPGYLLNVDWSRTRAYGVGFSGLYINVQGRERDGIVPWSERDALLREIGDKLLATIDPSTGSPAVTQFHPRDDYEHRGALEIGPDAIVGYAKGTQVANDSVLGEVMGEVFSDNDSRFEGHHIMDHRSVPGVLLTNRPLAQPATRLQDLAASILFEFGISGGFPRTES